MRLWSLHPSYLDSKGLVAVWREGLLALHVLSGQTKGYKQHPQLIRFKQQADPVQAITYYLHCIVDEADIREYSFQRGKLPERSKEKPVLIPVTEGQIEFEKEHLFQKLLKRDPKRTSLLAQQTKIKAHSLFKIIPGPIESWEVV